MKKSRARYRILLTIVLGLFLALSADAATLTVNSAADAGGVCPGTNCTLRQAIITAATGDTINFSADVTTIVLTSGQLLLSRDVTITGPGARTLVIKGNSNSRTFEIAAAATANISGMTIREGKGGIVVGTVRGGGGVANFGTANMFDCAVSNNIGGDGTHNGAQGGGVYNHAGANLRMERCTIASNLAHGSQALGGGLFNNGVAVLKNCTVADNQLLVNATNGSATGAGIYNLSSNTVGVITLINCTVSDNSFGVGAANAQLFGAGVRNQPGGGTCTLRNTIIARNQTGVQSPDVAGAFVSEGHNLIGNTSGGTGFIADGNNPDHDFLGGATDATALNPQLGVLQNNSGPTDTLALNLTSIAIDNGDDSVLSLPSSLVTDQRGFLRKSGLHVDIGAFEKGPPQTGQTLTVTTIDEHNDQTCSTDDCTLVEALNVSNASTDANTINFVPGLTGAIGTALLAPTGLAITNPVNINGPGARTLTVTGRTTARVFRVTSQNVVISGLGIVNGKVTNADGGAIHNTGGLTLNDCAILNSVAAGAAANGGGVFNGSGAALRLNRCAFIGDVAGQFGGGIYNDGTLDAGNCTFSLCTAVRGGGIISRFAGGASSTQLLQCTLTACTSTSTGTTSGDGGGGIYAEGGAQQYLITNTIFAGNVSSANPPTNWDVRGNFTSFGGNFIGNVGFSTGFSDGVNGDQVGGGLINPSDPNGGRHPSKNARLDSIKNNGGPTDTHALLVDSTARDAGSDSPLPTDQRGYYRNGAPDIGAFEFNGIIAGVPIVTTAPATNITTTSATLNAGVNPNGLSTLFQFALGNTFFDVQNAGNGTVDVPFSLNVTGLTPNTQYSFNVYATNAAGQTQPGVQQTFTTSAVPPGVVANVATRLPVGTGDNVLIEGFIVLGPNGSTKKIIVRAIGPSLIPFGIADALGNPTLEIRDGSNAVVATNDDWGTTQVGGIITGDQSGEISGSGLGPGNNLESAIIANLAPGSYTAVVRGVGNTVGTGVVDAFDMSAASAARLANIATRGLIQPGDKLMIAGFIIQSGDVRLVVRAIGPSLGAFGIGNALPDTTLQLRDQNGALVRENDDWQSDQKAELEGSGLQPSDPREAAVVATIPPGQYTVQVRGKPETTGIGVVQVYFLQ